jgi:hypothetical protein
VLSDIDAKFSKFMDKECDVVSAEVRKWFKKLMVRLESVARGFFGELMSVFPRKKRKCTTIRLPMPI